MKQPVVPKENIPSLDNFRLDDIKFLSGPLEVANDKGKLFTLAYVRLNSASNQKALTEDHAIKACTLEFRSTLVIHSHMW